MTNLDVKERLEDAQSLNIDLAELGARASKLGVEIADINGVVGDLSDISEKQNHHVREAVQASRQMDSANQKLSSSMTDVRHSADNARNILSYSAEKIAATVEGSASKMKILSENAIEFRDSLVAVDDTAKKVQSASASISQIARETQLLSLNASVEAARAGESGKGFAIIATAVKTLADEIQGFANQNADNLEKLMGILRELQEHSANSVELATEAISEASEAKRTGEQLNELVHSVGQLVNDIEAMNQPVSDNLSAAKSISGELRELHGTLKTSNQKLDVATERTGNILDISENLMLLIAQSGVETADTKFIHAAQDLAAQVSTVFEEAIKNGDISQSDMFDQNYRPIEGTDPQQVTTRYLWLTDERLPTIQEAALQLDARVAFCAAVDTNGYLPTHNLQYSRRPSDDPVWNAANCRNRRIFDDRTGLSAGQNTNPFLLQTYRRDMGGGNFVLMKDVSAPVYVNGRHWGGVRLGYKA